MEGNTLKVKAKNASSADGGKRRIPRRKTRAGLCLVEVMVAIVVLLIATSAAFMSQLTSMRMVEQSREIGVAISDLEAAMDRVRTSSMDSLAVPGSTYEHDGSIDQYDDLHLRDQRIVVSYPEYVAGNDLPNPLRIVLTATWTDRRGGARFETLQTARVE